MATTYKIYGTRQGTQFSFDVAIANESSDRGRWRMSSAKGRSTLEPTLAPGGKYYVHGPLQRRLGHRDALGLGGGRPPDRVGGRRTRMRLAPLCGRSRAR